MMSTNPPTISSRGLSRRSFVMAMGTTILGSFFLPTPSLGAVGETLTEPPVPESPVGGLVRRLLAGPVWSTDKTKLAWLETFDSDGKPHVMAWHPETDAEWAEARRFSEIALWRSWRTLPELHALLQQPGPWLIRQNFLETYCFLRTTAEPILLDTQKDEAFSYDVAQAVRVTSDRAMELIPRLMDMGYGKWTGGGPYLEPVKPEDARKNFRSSVFPVA
jgi:hypothetical protein